MFWRSRRCGFCMVLRGRIEQYSCDQLSRCSVVSAATYWTILAHPGETTRIFEGYNGLVYGVSPQQYRLLSRWMLAQYDVSVIAVSWGPKVGPLFTETTSPKVGPWDGKAARKPKVGSLVLVHVSSRSECRTSVYQNYTSVSRTARHGSV